jgi:hypothetical protein
MPAAPIVVEATLAEFIRKARSNHELPIRLKPEMRGPASADIAKNLAPKFTEAEMRAEFNRWATKNHSAFRSKAEVDMDYRIELARAEQRRTAVKTQGVVANMTAMEKLELANRRAEAEKNR